MLTQRSGAKFRDVVGDPGGNREQRRAAARLGEHGPVAPVAMAGILVLVDLLRRPQPEGHRP